MMNLGRTPAIFVSSTCYDLKQIRMDIKDFIENQLGYEAVLSEYDSFPLDPDIGTVENCIRAVRERADRVFQNTRQARWPFDGDGRPEYFE